MQLLTASLSPHVRDNVTTRRIMLDVLIALAPATVMAAVYFGVNAIYIILMCVLSAVAGEAAMNKAMRKPWSIGDLSAVVTGLLLALNLPAGIPLWIPVVGGAFATVVVKQCFGGIGKNFMNPALAARALLMASWPVHMTHYPSPFTNVDAITSATPLAAFSAEHAPKAEYLDLLLGNVGGCMGEVCKVALLAGAIYLFARRVITWRIPVVYMGTVALLTLITGGDVPYMLLSGGLILGACFMATDYATTPITALGQIVFAVGCGAITFAIRTYGSYPEGVSYAILLMNIAAPIIERFTRPRRFGEVKRVA